MELAERSLRQFDRVEYPLELRRLSDEIALAKAELDSFERQIAEYKRFPHDRYTQPFFFTLEQARLGRLEAELRWKRLREEKCRLIQFKGEHRRDRVLDVEEAQGWVEQFGGAKRA